MVEFKIGVDGTPYLMEINGRLWGSLQLAIDCGVDFPWLLHQNTLARAIPDQQPYKIGRRLRWVLGDLDNLLIQLRTGRLSVSSKLSALGRFLAAFLDSSSRQEIFRWGDTAPAFFELKSWLRALT
jgi:predicted ATP-grasp superfamily ATP-dependent carboligase